MNQAAVIIAVLFSAVYPVHRTATKPGQTTTKAPARVALIGFVRSGTTTNSLPLELALSEALSRDPRVAFVDQSIVRPALAGIGYDGSINMSKDEARKLGAAIGCDFFIIGKAEVLTRSEHENESHEEAYTGVMIVDGRTGALADFEFISEKAATRESALNAVTKT